MTVLSNNKASSATPPLVWCCAKPDAQLDDLVTIDPRYDVVVHINDPLELFNRIQLAVIKIAPWATFQAGSVVYNKCGKATSYQWGKCRFQKHAKYAVQHEYRFIADEPFGTYKGGKIIPAFKEKAFLDISIGLCVDILKIEKRGSLLSVR